jgi:hypothetical protein
MTAFLAEIGEKLADRWAALLVAPGLLFLASAVTAFWLGQRHALSYQALGHHVTVLAASPGFKSVGGTVLVVIGVLAGSVFTGLAASAFGRLLEMTWTLPGTYPLTRSLANWRRKRSADAKAIADDETAAPDQVRRAMARADRIGLIEPGCPTWIGDRLRACRVRVAKSCGLDVDVAWPRLWLIIPDHVRRELTSARDDFATAARLVAWAVFYLILGVWWWPAAVIAVVTLVSGVIKARNATANLADLIESAFDLYGAQLAAQLGERTDGALPAELGARLTARMRKSRWDPGSPLAD